MTPYDYSKIAAILGTYTTLEVQEALEKLDGDFMVPEITYLIGEEAYDAAGEEYYPDDEAQNETEHDGWFCRLSAPGYLDATEWTGPHETEHHAWADLISLYDEY